MCIRRAEDAQTKMELFSHTQTDNSTLIHFAHHLTYPLHIQHNTKASYVLQLRKFTQAIPTPGIYMLRFCTFLYDVMHLIHVVVCIH